MEQSLSVLKYATPYIRYFKNKTFVVKLGGAILADEEALEDISEQIVLLTHLGIKVVVVHGGGPQATAMIQRLGFQTQFVAGRRVTDTHTLEVARMVYRGTLNLQLVEYLGRLGGRAVGLSGVDGGLVMAHKRPPVKMKPGQDEEEILVDYGFVGDIDHVDPYVLEYLLGGGFIPVICSLAQDETCHTLNVNADTLAAHIAGALHAEKLMILCEVKGILQDTARPDSLIPYIDKEGIQEEIAAGHISGGMLPKVDAALKALEMGVERVHIISGMDDDTILKEVFTNEGCGTLVVLDEETVPEVPVDLPKYVRSDIGDA